MTSGRSVSFWISVTACVISSASSASGAPMFTSSSMAPPATWSLTSISTRDRSPLRSCSWKSFRPVGLIRSPMIANGWSSPIRTVLVAEDTMVCTDFSSLLVSGRAQAPTMARRRAISSLARDTAAVASAAYPSAPTTSAYSWVTGAPPTMTMTWSRSPDFCSALMFALNIGIVVVRNAEKPDDVRLVLLDRLDELLRRDLHAQVDDLEAGALEHDVDQVLADVVHVTLDRPITMVPIASAPVSASSGRRICSAPTIALPAMSISGTKKSPRSNLAPTSSRDGISASYSSTSGPRPMARPWLVNSITAGALPTRVSS